MRMPHFACLCVILAAFSFAPPAFADDAPKERKRARSLIGTPVNVNTAGAGSLPKGMALTMINASFSDKSRAKRGGGSRADVFQQTWLYKMRYGITDRFEAAVTVPWVHMTNSNRPAGTRKHVEGFGDSVLQFTVAPLQQHREIRWPCRLLPAFFSRRGRPARRTCPGTTPGGRGGRRPSAPG